MINTLKKIILKRFKHVELKLLKLREHQVYLALLMEQLLILEIGILDKKIRMNGYL